MTFPYFLEPLSFPQDPLGDSPFDSIFDLEIEEPIVLERFGENFGSDDPFSPQSFSDLPILPLSNEFGSSIDSQTT